MMLLTFFGTVASIAGVTGIFMEMNLEQLDVDFLAGGLLPDNMLYEFPDESNTNSFDQMQVDLNMDGFSLLPEEPTIDPFSQLLDDIDDFDPSLDGIFISRDGSTTSPAPEVSSLDDTFLQDNLIVADAESGTLPDRTPSCAKFFGLACCTGEPSQSSESAMGALPLTDVSGCSGCMCSFPYV
jgi:hypothetical protein